MTETLSLGVLVPCRNEARVVARKVANLARARWPAGARGERPAHRLVLVDDGSDDGTAHAARAALAACADALAASGVAAEVVANDVRPGKPGAIAAGLARLPGVDLVLLSDADVVVEPEALCALAQAFERDPELALACGAQRFVRDLADDGTLAAAHGGEPVPAASAFDRWTARVRALEARAGRLFSVHGQLLAWRAALGLVPTPGIAADDLDLMLQVRARATADGRPAGERPAAWRVELVDAARFLEVKARGSAAREQALRRARAYVQVVRAWDARAPVGSGAARVQWLFYRHVPLAAPALSVAAALALLCGALLAFGVLGLIAALALLALGSATLARGWIALMLCIREAARAERAAPLPERWEMARR